MQSIDRKFGEPTFFEGNIENGCFFQNSITGMGTIIIDDDFLKEMEALAEPLKSQKKLIDLTAEVYNLVCSYYFSSEENNANRFQTYENNLVIDDDGMILGTKLSSLKGKNIAVCSEKSIAAYSIFNALFNAKASKRSPELVLSNLATSTTGDVPHAFIILNNSSDEKLPHILFDVENLSKIEDANGNAYTCPGLYFLSNEEYEALKSGFKCTPVSLFELIGNFHETGDRRIFGQNEQPNR